MQFTLYSLLLIFSCSLSVWTGYYARKQKNSKEGNYLLALIISTGFWAFFALLESIALALPVKIAFAQIKYLGLTSAPVFVLLFVLKYTRNLTEFKLSHFFLFFFIPVITMIGVFTNSLFHLQWPNASLVYQPFSGVTVLYLHGINFWVITTYSYILILIGLFVLLKTSFKYPKQYAAQVIIVLLSFSIPVCATIGYLLMGEQSVRIDVSPLTFPIGGFLLLTGMKLYGLLKVRPMANDFLFNSMQDGVMYLDADEQIIDLNKSAADIMKTCFNADFAKIGKKKLSLYPEFYSFYKSASLNHLEFSLAEDFYEIREHELNDKGNNIVGKVIVFRNITEQKASQAIIQNQNDQLLKLNQQKDKMFSIISHDLRSPLASIIGLAEIMSESFDRITEEERKKILSLFLSRTKTTYDLIENLLQWSKLQNSGVENTVQKIDLDSLMKKTVNFYRSIAADKQIKLALIENTQEQPEIAGNEQLLMTILRNLITNAIKFTHQKGEIFVSHEYFSSNFQVCVSDTGVGIPEESLKKLFNLENPFYTLGTANEIGSGLGLNLCFEFVKKMGGEIWIKSEVGVGTKIYFSLPYHLPFN